MSATTVKHDADGFVDCACGQRHWGLAGAAGLLVWRLHRGRLEILLQERAEWTQQGGTWGIPGGARQWEESAIAGALREANEEAGIDPRTVAIGFTHRQLHPDWSYVTVIARALGDFTYQADGHESVSLRWVAWDQLAYYPLHPALDAMREELAPLLHIPVVLVDSANVVGSRPDGWWNDRVGAAGRLYRQLVDLTERGWPGRVFDISALKMYPLTIQVTEGQANAMEEEGPVIIHRADASGDDALVELTEAIDAGLAGAVSEAGVVRAITSDRELTERLRAAGAEVFPSSTVDKASGTAGAHHRGKRRGRSRARR